MTYTITDIKYDKDNVKVKLPKTLNINVPSILEEDDEIEDFLSDEISNITGFCHDGFNYVLKPNTTTP